jgi:hypothetical protein
MSLITVIGRGHSGTRAMSHTLSRSGVFMGEPLNDSGDLIPGADMYDACRIFAEYVDRREGMTWDWSRALSADLPGAFAAKVRSYLASVLASTNSRRGWKIPETTLCFPWMVRMFPDAKYIFWIRDPRDCIIGGHLTDDLADFGIDYPRTDNVRERRAISWQYQFELVRSAPKPRQWIEVRFEDFVLRQEQTLARLERFLGFELARIPVRPEAVGRWRRDEKIASEGPHDFAFFRPAMREYGYAATQEEQIV